MAQDGITDAEADAMLCQLEGRVPSAYQETEETAKGPSLRAALELECR